MKEKVHATEIARRSWSEGIWMYLFHDSALQKGKKAVLVVLAPDRTDPAFAAMYETFTEEERELDEIHNVRVFFEDHPAGYLHEKFDLSPQQFQWYLIDIHGTLVAHSDKVVSIMNVLQMLEGKAKDEDVRFEPTH